MLVGLKKVRRGQKGRGVDTDMDTYHSPSSTNLCAAFLAAAMCLAN